MEAAQWGFLTGVPHRGAPAALELASSAPCVMRAWHSEALAQLVGHGSALTVIPCRQDLEILLSKNTGMGDPPRRHLLCRALHGSTVWGRKQWLGKERCNKDHHSYSEVTKLALD